ncbi:FUSC family protein [Granulicella cerasi]|uniref:FUSC family protein n=1 Tax=Granulicella cerasi TaxID=741063 RepID=A0ABW1ZBU6_9BACT|nr:FUSC family protein [Granulicella cerasi]
MSKTRKFGRLLQDEMTPYPGRAAGALRDTLVLLLSVALAMTFRTPGMQLAAALLLLMQRERPGLTMRVALEIIVSTALALAVSCTWVQLTDGTEGARFYGVMVLIFCSAFCMVASTMALPSTIFGFYGFVFLSNWDGHHSADYNVRFGLNYLASMALGVACLVAVEYGFGTRHPAEELARELRRRMSALAELFSSLANDEPRNDPHSFRQTHRKVLQLAHAGDMRLRELYDRFRDSSAAQDVPVGLQYRIGIATRALQRSVALGFSTQQEESGVERLRAYAALAELCRAAAEDKAPTTSAHFESDSRTLQELHAELGEYLAVQHASGEIAAEPQASRMKARSAFFVPDAFTTPDAAVYALKLTLAAMICYVLYNAIAWPGILTCVVTVLFTGLSTTGAMKQKQLYRFSGAAIGGLIGIFVVSVFFPNMDSITSLIVLFAPICFFAGWVMRSPNMGYIGVQIAFAFFLTTIGGFGPSTQVTPARDRLIGVALGILALWLVFDQLWPVRTTDALRRTLQRIGLATEQLRTEENAGRFESLRSMVSTELANAQQLEVAVHFDVGRHQKRELLETRKLLHRIEAAAAEFYAEAASHF